MRLNGLGGDAAIAALADSQHRVVTRTELLALGLTPAMVDWRIRHGRLHPKFRGVYAVGTPTLTPREHTFAAVRAVGGDGVAAAASGAGLLGLSVWLPPTPHVLTARSIAGPRGVVVHRTDRLLPEDRAIVDGIAVVSVTRLLLDAAASGDVKRLERWWREAMRARTLDEGAIARRIDGGRPGSGVLRSLLSTAPELPAATTFEQAFAALIELAGLPEPEREVSFGRYRLDFFWPHLMLAAEADSWKEHGHVGGFENDRDRDIELHNEFGIVTLRFTHRKVTREPDRVVKQLVGAAAQASTRQHRGVVVTR